MTSPRRSCPNAKFGPSTIPRACELAADHAIEELAGRELEQPGPGPENAHLGGAGLVKQRDLALRPDEGHRSLVRAARGRPDGDRT